MLRQTSALALVVSLGATSCVTTDIARTSRGLSPTSDISVSVCGTASIAHSHSLVATPVHTRLLRLDDGSTLVHDSLNSRWSLSGLAAGRYRLEVLGWQRQDGRVIRFRSPPTETFFVRPSQHVELHVILSDKRGWLYTVFGHVLAGASIAVLSRHTK